VSNPVGRVKILYLLISLGIAIAIIAPSFFQWHFFERSWDYLLLPGIAFGTVLFGHSVRMVYAAYAFNLFFYWGLIFSCLRWIALGSRKS
jgi:hypothetical protein